MEPKLSPARPNDKAEQMFVAGLAAPAIRYRDRQVRMRRASIRAAATIIGAARVIAACGPQPAAAPGGNPGDRRTPRDDGEVHHLR